MVVKRKIWIFDITTYNDAVQHEHNVLNYRGAWCYNTDNNTAKDMTFMQHFLLAQCNKSKEWSTMKALKHSDVAALGDIIWQTMIL